MLKHVRTCVHALQGCGQEEHAYEGFTAWRLIARRALTGSSDAAVATLAADAALLQQFYRGWLLPYETHLFERGCSEEGAAAHRTGAVTLKAGLLRDLAMEATQDRLVCAAVAGWAAKLSGTASDAAAALPAGNGVLAPVSRRCMRSPCGLLM